MTTCRSHSRTLAEGLLRPGILLRDMDAPAEEAEGARTNSIPIRAQYEYSYSTQFGLLRVLLGKSAKMQSVRVGTHAYRMSRLM